MAQPRILFELTIIVYVYNRMLRLKNSWNRFLKSEIWSTNVFQQSTFGFNVGRRFVAKWGSWGRFKFDTRFNFGRIRKGLEEIWDELKVMSWHKTWREIRLQDQDSSEKRFESRVFFYCGSEYFEWIKKPLMIHWKEVWMIYHWIENSSSWTIWNWAKPHYILALIIELE